MSINRVTSLESGFGFGFGFGFGLRVDQSRDLAARVLDGLAGLAAERVREGFEARAEGVDAEVEDLLACEGGELLHDWQSSLVWGKIQGDTGRYRETQRKAGNSCMTGRAAWFRIRAGVRVRVRVRVRARARANPKPKPNLGEADCTVDVGGGAERHLVRVRVRNGVRVRVRVRG